MEFRDYPEYNFVSIQIGVTRPFLVYGFDQKAAKVFGFNLHLFYVLFGS